MENIIIDSEKSQQGDNCVLWMCISVFLKSIYISSHSFDLSISSWASKDEN